jgi:O-antigen/teichoic acid export membrane protein
MKKPDQKIEEITAYGKKLGGWVLKGGLSVLDLVIYSGSMFLVSVLLARWLSVEEYGIFALAMVVTTFFYQVQNSLIIEPMSVIGPSRYPQSLSRYLSKQRTFHFVIFIGIGLVIIISALIYRALGGDTQVFEILILLGLLAALLQLPWMIRRSFYVLGEPFSAVLYSLAYALVTIGVLFLFKHNGWLSTANILILLAISGLVAVGIIFSRLIQNTKISTDLNNRELWKENWGFGRWMLLTGFTFVIAGQAPILLAGVLINAEASGVIKAMQNFMLPMVMVISTLVAIVVPHLAGENGQRNRKESQKKIIPFAILIIIMAGIYGLILMVFSKPLETLLYQGKYSGFSFLIPLWGWMPFLMAWGTLPSVYFRLHQKTQAIFQSALVWMIFTLIASIPLTIVWGVIGVTIGTVIGYVAYSAAYLVIYWRVRT